MKGYTVIQPWASLIVYGPKRIETRGHPNLSALIGKRHFIHAGKSLEYVRDDIEGKEKELGFKLPFGAILGTAIMVRAFRGDTIPKEHLKLCEQKACCSIQADTWCYSLAGLRPLEEPIPCSGKQGIWEFNDARLGV